MTASHKRGVQLRKAFLTSALAKAAGFALQFLTLPAVIWALGEGYYAAYLALTASLAWVGLMSFGLLPSLSRSLAANATVGNVDGQRDLLAAGIGFVGFVGLVLAVGLLAVSAAVDLRDFAGSQALSLSEFRRAFAAATLIMALLFFTTIASAVRAGFQESHITNLWALAATAIIIVTTSWVAHYAPSLTAFIIAIQAPMALVAAADLLLIVSQRPYLRSRPVLRRSALSALLQSSWSVWLVQLTAFLNVQASLLVVAAVDGPAAAAGYGSVLRLELLLSGIVALVLTPLVPAIAEAESLREIGWVRTSYRRILLYTLTLSGLAGATIALFGPWIIAQWLGPELDVPPTMSAALGGYFIVWMLQFALFNVSLGLGETKGLGRIFAAETALIVLIGGALLPRYGATGMAIGLLIGTLGVTAWVLPLRIRRSLQRREALLQLPPAA